MGVYDGFDDYPYRRPRSKEEQLGDAAYEGKVKKIAELLDNGARINAHDGLALRYAARKKHKKAVEFLLDRGADIHLSVNAARNANEHDTVTFMEAIAARRRQREVDENFDGFDKQSDTTALRKQFLDNGKMIVTQIFDFKTHEVTTIVVNDGTQSMFVRNFQDMEDPQIIERAAQSLRAQGGDPPEWRSTYAKKRKPGAPLSLGN